MKADCTQVPIVTSQKKVEIMIPKVLQIKKKNSFGEVVNN